MAAALAAGLLIALSVPPAGWWPLGIIGVGVLGWLLEGKGRRARALIGFAGGVGLYGVTLAWMADFNLIGAVVVMAAEAGCLAVAALATPPGRGRQAGWIGALVIQEWIRSHVPVGGLPLGGIPLGQASGPLAPAARIGGALLVTGLVAAAGVVGESVVGRRQVMFSIGAATAVVTLPFAGLWAPSGHVVAPLRIAAVQGGGRRGLRAIRTDPLIVLNAAFAASQQIRPPVDLILWPEDVVALPGPVAGSPVGERIGAIAAALRAPLLAGVTEDVDPDRFRNAEVAWDASGRISGRYDKVHRVPFGEYVPGRSLLRHVVSLDVIPRDAIGGAGTGRLDTDAGPVGVVISFEIFFSDRARAAIRAGGQVLLGPTNTASYKTTQVSASEVATATLRAWETGRDVVLVAPTGFSAVIDSRGRVEQRSRLGTAQVLQAIVHRRTGSTPYLSWGDLPVLVAAGALAGRGWALALLDRPVNSGNH